ncbi:MAG: hypothetical protein LBQ12_03620 [Deltaproteobacteria bacterium]|jgi:tetratricopeptide (TPR) repeat protein|nr:hypothetical protein [Deltaproteobacteria bacterium]
MDFATELASAEAELDACGKLAEAIPGSKGGAKAKRSEEKALARLREADARLEAAAAARGEAGSEALGAALGKAVALASRLGDLDLAKSSAERLMGLPSVGGNALRKLEAGSALVADFAMCCDFDSALSILADLKKFASGKETPPGKEYASCWLAAAAGLAAALSDCGRPKDALDVYSSMRPFRRLEPSGPARAGAAAKIVEALTRAEDLEKAFAVFREMGSYSSGDEPFRLYMKAGFTLLLPLSRSTGQEGRFSFLARAFSDPREAPEKSALRGEAALAFVEERAREGDLEGARAVLNAFDDFSGPALVAVSRAKAAGALAEALMDDSRLDEALSLLLAHSLFCFASPAAISATADAYAAMRGRRGFPADYPGDLALPCYRSLFSACLRLASEYSDAMRDDDARAFLRTAATVGRDDGDRIPFAEAALAAVEEDCRNGFGTEALGLYRAFAPRKGSEPVMYLTCRMGAAVVRSLCSLGIADEAVRMLSGLPAARRPGDRIYYERLQAQMHAFNALLKLGLFGKANRLYRRLADFSGPEKAAWKWLKAAGKLVEAYVYDSAWPKARKIFDNARRESPKGGKFTLRLYAMASDIITACCENSDFMSAAEIFSSLPDAGGEPKLEEERFEISQHLAAYMCHRGKVQDALELFRGIPVESPTGKLPALKARVAAWLIADLSGRGLAEEAASVYESLAGLGPAEGVDVIRAKSAIRLATSFTQSGRTDRALELILSIPAFCDPGRVGRQLRAAAVALSLVLAKGDEGDKANVLRAFTAKFLQGAP